jgi:tetratricopeptide (TPR) repeat protein
MPPSRAGLDKTSMIYGKLQLRTCGIALLSSLNLACGVAAQTAREGSCSTGDAHQQVECWAGAAAQDVNSGRYAAAIEKYQALLRLQPNSPGALSNLGVAYHLDGQISKAVETLQQALRLDPDLIPASLILGMDNVRLGKPQDALQPLRRVLQREPQHRDALLALASAYFATGDYAAAAGTYHTEIGFRGDDADAWYGMGLCYEHLAESTARQMQQRGADSAYYHRLVGEFLTEQGTEIDAEVAFRRALGLAGKDNVGLNAALGFARLRLGVIDEADADFKRELQLHPGNLEAELGLSAIAFARKQNAPALAALCKIHQADESFLVSRLPFFVASLDSQVQSKVESYLRGSGSTTCPPVAPLLAKEIASPGTAAEFAHAFDPATARNQQTSPACSTLAQRLPSLNYQESLRLSQCSFLSGRYLASLDAAKTAVRREPHTLAGLYWQAEASRHLAQAAFQKAVELKPDSWQGNILIGDIYRQRKKWTEAIQHYESAASLNPSVPASFLGMATVHWQTGEFDQANADLHKVLALDPANIQANFELGDIAVRRHQFQSAIPNLQKAIAQDPNLLVAHADLGKALAGVGNVQDALAELTRAEPVDRYGDIHYQLFLLYRNVGQKEKAEQALAISERLRKQEIQTQSTRLMRATEASEDGKQESSDDLPHHP